NLIGEHIDYCDGFVLPLAINRHIVIAAALNNSGMARVRSMGEEEAVISLEDPQAPATPPWTNYLRGVLEGFRLRGSWPVPGFDAVIVSNLPIGGGLSSSAALELAFATIVEGLVDTVLDTREKALLCQKAEHDFAGVPCGIMDQFASAFGQQDNLVLIDCQSQDPELVPFPSSDLSVLVANTMIRHKLADGEYRARREDTERALALLGKSNWREVNPADLETLRNEPDDLLFRRARHVVSEIARTRESAKELRQDNYAALGPHMAASHQSLRDDFEVSCGELDLMVRIANEIGFEGGVLGSRMTGGGFGGSTVTLCRGEQLHEIAARLSVAYEEESGHTPQLFATRPVQGARLL
ncbi:MAG: galactokinase, partial [Roseibacillus sp.]|nr:galactokinase [Roseibacillus sp.]